MSDRTPEPMMEGFTEEESALAVDLARLINKLATRFCIDRGLSFQQGVPIIRRGTMTALLSGMAAGGVQGVGNTDALLIEEMDRLKRAADKVRLATEPTRGAA